MGEPHDGRMVVEYRVPVFAIVNLDPATPHSPVEEVVVDDEKIEGPVGVKFQLTRLSAKPGTKTEQLARRVAESAIWPAWKVGW